MRFHRAIVGQTTFNQFARAHEAMITTESSIGSEEFRARAYLPMHASQGDILDEFLRIARSRFEAQQRAPVIEINQFRRQA
jgi:hypothetical protein